MIGFPLEHKSSNSAATKKYVVFLSDAICFIIMSAPSLLIIVINYPSRSYIAQ